MENKSGGEPTLIKRNYASRQQGFYVVSDATATLNKKGIDGQNFSAELMHETALASLNGEFAKVITTDFLRKNI